MDEFVDNLAKAIGFKEYMSVTESLKRKILGNGESGKVVVKKKYLCLLALTSYFIAEQSRFSRVWDAFDRGARKYKANNGTPPVLILDNMSKLNQENVKMMKNLQDIAKLYADQSSCIIVFISSEETVSRMMMREYCMI